VRKNWVKDVSVKAKRDAEGEMKGERGERERKEKKRERV
jgi:hypothetical protein